MGRVEKKTQLLPEEHVMWHNICVHVQHSVTRSHICKFNFLIGPVKTWMRENAAIKTQQIIKVLRELVQFGENYDSFLMSKIHIIG